jgi:hypothetical protein
MAQPFRTLIVAAAVSLGVSGVANAGVIVTVDGTEYEIGTVQDSFTDIEAELDVTPWWVASDSGQTATDFAAAVDAALGYPNDTSPPPDGPLFAYGTVDSEIDTVFEIEGAGTASDVQLPATVATYAVIEAWDVPEPGTIGAMLMGFGPLGLWADKRRRAKARG